MGPQWNRSEHPPPTAEEIAVTRAILARARASIAVIVARHPNPYAVDLVRSWDLSRDALNDAAHRLDLPPVTDAEWHMITDQRGRTCSPSPS
ncbi:hypothetical protein [Spongiactinospora sp. TRM90649]|uniref:hypothetical protein n=1 Tax=Spongiactinospora sp. TRM90649 TaxID=3031114 RepID=UPI0023F8ACE0|nr:hypothetical protein [Spongiactinospora sp. TRM90649]